MFIILIFNNMAKSKVDYSDYIIPGIILTVAMIVAYFGITNSQNELSYNKCNAFYDEGLLLGEKGYIKGYDCYNTYRKRVIGDPIDNLNAHVLLEKKDTKSNKEDIIKLIEENEIDEIKYETIKKIITN